MADHPLNLESALAVLAAVLDVCAAIPGTTARQAGVPWVFPEVGAGPLGNGDTAQNTLATLTWDVISIVGVGNDETRMAYDPDVAIPGDTYEPNPAAPSERLGGAVATVSGNRVINVQVRCETYASTPAGPFIYLERVRMRLALPTVTDTLEQAGLAIQNINDARSLGERTDGSGRALRVAVLEIFLNTADCFSDDPTTTIEQIETDTSEIT